MMELEERLQYILLRIKKLQVVYEQQKAELAALRKKNNQLVKEYDALKKINFEQKKQIEIADIANQLSDEEERGNKETKRKLDKYIREVDAVIAALKKME